MNETAASLTQDQRACMRFSRLIGLQAQSDLLALQIRQEITALVEQDTPFGHRPFVPDELSMAIAESSRTCEGRVDNARITVAHPRLMALVAASAQAALAPGEAIVTHEFGIRHLDACVDELGGAPVAVQDQVLALVLPDPDVRTPHQHRKAIRAARMLLDLEGTQDKQDRIHDKRDVRLLDETDGSASLLVGGKKSSAAEMLAAIDAQPGVEVPNPGDTRPLGQRRYDFVQDLLCGRVQVTAPWQALIVVSLETLEGGDAPAEIPGLGLVSAEEAREICAKADLRRAVVDAHGRLVSLDDVALSGNSEPLGAAPTDLTSHEVEPELVDDVPATATAEQWEWLAAQQPADVAEEAFLAAQASVREARLMALCSTGTDRLEQMLRDDEVGAQRRHALAGAGWTWSAGRPAPRCPPTCTATCPTPTRTRRTTSRSLPEEAGHAGPAPSVLAATDEGPPPNGRPPT
ncbi:MAG: hypothetical protein JWO22_2378, partial [Frankiales bacterium]|nr:hypothetical protein [Frankiales bacterium]